MLGAVRARPRSNKALGPRVGDGSLDFLEQVERAEVRDSYRQHRQDADMWQTSNGVVNQQMQATHKQALQRQHENTIRDLLHDEYGITGAAAEREIALWRAEQPVMITSAGKQISVFRLGNQVTIIL